MSEDEAQVPSLPGGPSPSPELLDELIDWLRIPSISTGAVDAAAMNAAADWVCERVIAAGGTAERSAEHGGNPLAVGDLRCGDDEAPTVLIYGHSGSDRS